VSKHVALINTKNFVVLKVFLCTFIARKHSGISALTIAFSMTDKKLSFVKNEWNIRC
jgi:hypothetical protein